MMEFGIRWIFEGEGDPDTMRAIMTNEPLRLGHPFNCEVFVTQMNRCRENGLTITEVLFRPIIRVQPEE